MLLVCLPGLPVVAAASACATDENKEVVHRCRKDKHEEKGGVSRPDAAIADTLLLLLLQLLLQGKLCVCVVWCVEWSSSLSTPTGCPPAGVHSSTIAPLSL